MDRRVTSCPLDINGSEPIGKEYGILTGVVCFIYYIVNQKWIAKNPLILYIEHRGTEARRDKYIEKVKTIEPDFTL